MIVFKQKTAWEIGKGEWSVEVFFFQAEDGIRDTSVTGVQTCALPICSMYSEGIESYVPVKTATHRYCKSGTTDHALRLKQIGRASCRERV